MKNPTQSALWALTFSLFALFSCNDASVIGSDLLTGDELDIAFTDTITLEARTVLNDSIKVFDASANGVSVQNFAYGDFQDPIFGRSVSSIYAQLITTSEPAFGGSTTATLDSVVIMIAYNPALSYGKLDEPFTMEVYEMNEALESDEVYFSTDSFSVKSAPIATTTFLPNVTDSITVIGARGDTAFSERLAPHLRIALDPNNPFALSLFDADTAVLNNDDIFLDSFMGIWLKPASINAGMLSFIMRSLNTNIRVYYHEGDDFKQYDFRSYATNPVTMLLRNYYGGSIAGQYISEDGEERNDTLLFLQGLNGVNVEFEIPFPESFKGIIINKAELILPIVTLPEDSDEYEPVEQLYALEVVTDTSKADIDDILLAALRYSLADFGNYFGGKVTAEDNYKASISAHFQKMAEGEVSNKILLTPYLKQERPARVVLGGPGHSAGGAKLRITYTRY